MREGIKKFLERDAVFYFEKLWSALDENKFDILESEWITVDKNLGISSSCKFSPLLNMHDVYMKYINGNSAQPLLTFNVVPERDKTTIVLTWLKEHGELTAWVKDKTENLEGKEELINMGAFAESEDTCISPLIWESLSEEMILSVKNAMRHELWRGELGKIPKVVKLENS